MSDSKNFNYKIQDWFEHDKFGVMVSIASPELDKLSKDEIKNLVGDQVAILDSTSDEKKWAKVSEIEIANSIIDKKNIHICLGSSIKLSDIKPNSDIISFPNKRTEKQENREVNRFMKSKIKILVLAANPVNTSQLRLGEEVRSIQEELERAKYRDRFELISQWAVRVRDLSRALLNHKPQIVHFSGHGTGSQDDSTTRKLIPLPDAFEPEGLVLEDDRGRATLVSTDALAGLFKRLENDVKCVVLNACHSKTQAEAIHRHIDCVMGMNKAIGDRAAIEFARVFYQALATGRSFDFAYQLALNSLDLASIPESLTPVLYNRRGSDDPFNIMTSPPDSDPPVTVPAPQPKPQVQPLGNISISGDNNPFAVTQASGNVSQNNSPQSIKISGGHISGQVGQAGRDLTQTQYQDGDKKQLTAAEVIQLIGKIEGLLKDSALPAREKNKSITYLEAVKEEAEAEEPDKKYAAKSLQKITDMLKNTNEAVDAGQSLWKKVTPILSQLLPWLGVTSKFLGF